MSILALDKWATFIRIIAKSGGPFKALYKLWRNDTLKVFIYLALGNDINYQLIFEEARTETIKRYSHSMFG